MGPRDKRAAGAAVTLAIILSQMVSGQCLPEHHFKLSSGSYTENVKSSNNMLMKKRASHNNGFFNYHSKAINFPDVEYPSEFEPEKYYRFLSEYPIQYKPNNDSISSSCNGRKSKMEATHKRRCNSNLNPTATTSFKDCDTLSQPYCFKRSNFFPEVEYPLSSRDMWGPKYWSRLQDANIHDDMETEGPVYRSAAEETADKTYYFDYNTSDLNTLSELLNTKNTQITGTIDNVITLQLDFPKGDKLEEIASNGTSSIKRDNNDQQSSILNQSSLCEISTTTFNPSLSNYEMNETSPSATSSTISDSIPVAKTDNPLESESTSNMINSINTGIPDILQQITSTPETCSNTSSGFEISPIQKQINDPLTIIIATAESSLTTILPPLSSDATIPSIHNSSSDNLNILRQTTSTPSLLPESTIPSDLEIKNINLSGLVDTTLTEPLVIETATTESSPITNMFTPLDNYETIPTTCQESSYSDITDTTAVPFLGITSPMSTPFVADIELDPPEDMISISHTLGSITSGQTNFSSDSQSIINSQPSLLNNVNDYCLIVADDYLQNASYTDAENFATEWMLNCSDSYIMSDPENSEEWVIYVDSENPLLPQGNSLDKLTDTWDYSTLENSTTDEVVNSTLLIRHVLAEKKDKSLEGTTTILDNIENSNITSLSQSNLTDTPAMVTAVPESEDYAFDVIYDTEITTEGVASNDYEYIMTGVDNSEFNKTLDTMQVSSDLNNSTLQYDYNDDSLTLYTNSPYDGYVS